MKKHIVQCFFWLILSVPLSLNAQHAASSSVDTTDAGYQIGYEIGSYIPVLIIITLALMVMYRARKYSKD